MIVQCPQCSSQYRVQDDKIPASGGRISCPSCDNNFVVHPDDSQSQQGNYGEDKTSVTDASQLQNRLAQMAEGMEGEDVDGADPGDVDPTEVMQGPNVPDFMAEDQGPGEAERDEDGTREMRNPYTGGEDGGERTTEDADRDDLIADAVEGATEIWEGADSMDGIQSDSGSVDDGPAPADHSGDTFDAPSGPQSVPPDGPPSTPDGAGGGDRGSSSPQQGNSPPRGKPAADRQSGGSQPGASAGNQPQQGRKGTRLGTGAVDQSGSSPGQPGGAQQGGGAPGPVGGGGQKTRQDQRREASGASAPSGVPAGGGGAGPSGEHDGPWKLKAEHGLTYEFPETDALRNWLADRDGIEKFDLSADGGSTFHDLADFPQVADLLGGGGSETSSSQQFASRNQGSVGGGGPANQPGGPGGSGGPGGGPPSDSPGGGSPNQPPSPGADRGPRGAPADRAGGQPSPPSDGPAWDDAFDDGGNADSTEAPQPVSTDGFELPSRDAVWNKVLYGILFVLIVLAAGVFLEVAHIYPVGKHVPGVPTTFDTDGSGQTAGLAEMGDETAYHKKAAKKADEDEAEAEDEKIRQVITAAEESIENNRLQTAIEKLKAAKLLDPKRPKIYELLGDVYEKLGQQDKADKNHQKAEKLRTERDKQGEAVTQKGDEKGESADDEKKEPSPGESPN